MKRRLFNRRTFVAAGVAGGLGALTIGPWGFNFVMDRVDEIGREVPAAPHKPSPASWSDNAVTLAWLGHATVLINFFGVRILTDPTLYPRIGVDLLLGSLGPLRLVQCALTPAEIPDIDLVLVSHAHFDHLDTPSLGSVRGIAIRRYRNFAGTTRHASPHREVRCWFAPFRSSTGAPAFAAIRGAAIPAGLWNAKAAGSSSPVTPRIRQRSANIDGSAHSTPL